MPENVKTICFIEKVCKLNEDHENRMQRFALPRPLRWRGPYLSQQNPYLSNGFDQNPDAPDDPDDPFLHYQHPILPFVAFRFASRP